MENLRIVFRVDNDQEVVAVFVDEKYNDSYLLTCYAHYGQHGCCSLSWLYHDSKPAKQESYMPLLKELKSIYNDTNLVVLNRLIPYGKQLELFQSKYHEKKA